MRKLLFLLFSVLFISCGVLPQKDNFNPNWKSNPIGSLGEKSVSVYKSDFEVFNVPDLKNKIKVSIDKRPFTKKVYRGYIKSNQKTGKPNVVNYEKDSSKKTFFYELSIQDKNTLINSITKNNSLLKYIQNTPDTKLISAVRFIPKTSIATILNTCDDFYLKTTDNGGLNILFFKNGKQVKSISVSTLDVFQYELSSLCWAVNSKNKLELSTIISANETCLEGNSTNINKLKKEIEENHIKF